MLDVPVAASPKPMSLPPAVVVVLNHSSSLYTVGFVNVRALTTPPPAPSVVTAVLDADGRAPGAPSVTPPM